MVFLKNFLIWLVMMGIFLFYIVPVIVSSGGGGILYQSPQTVFMPPVPVGGYNDRMAADFKYGHADGSDSDYDADRWRDVRYEEDRRREYDEEQNYYRSNTGTMNKNDDRNEGGESKKPVAEVVVEKRIPSFLDVVSFAFRHSMDTINDLAESVVTPTIVSEEKDNDWRR
jgi:hypothetical protein